MVAIKKIGYVSLCHNYIREKCWFEQVAEESNQWTGWWFQLFLFYRKIWEIPLTNISWLESWQPPPLRHGLLLGLKALTEEIRRILCAGYRTRHFRTARRCSCDMTSWHTVERSAQSIARYDKWNSGFGCFWYLHQTKKIISHSLISIHCEGATPLNQWTWPNMVGDRFFPLVSLLKFWRWHRSETHVFVPQDWLLRRDWRLIQNPRTQTHWNPAICQRKKKYRW